MSIPSKFKMTTLTLQDKHRAFPANSGSKLNDKVPLIKSLRQLTGLGLRDAKDLMDIYCEGLPVNVEVLASTDDELDVVMTRFKAESFDVVNHHLTAPVKQMRVQTVSGRVLALAKECIDNDMSGLASDLLEVYIKHFEA